MHSPGGPLRAPTASSVRGATSRGCIRSTPAVQHALPNASHNPCVPRSLGTRSGQRALAERTARRTVCSGMDTLPSLCGSSTAAGPARARACRQGWMQRAQPGAPQRRSPATCEPSRTSTRTLRTSSGRVYRLPSRRVSCGLRVSMTKVAPLLVRRRTGRRSRAGCAGASAGDCTTCI